MSNSPLRELPIRFQRVRQSRLITRKTITVLTNQYYILKVNCPSKIYTNYKNYRQSGKTVQGIKQQDKQPNGEIVHPQLNLVGVRGRVGARVGARGRVGARFRGAACRLCGVVCSLNGGRRRLIIPVRAAGNDVVAAEILATESEVRAAEGAVGGHDVTVMTRDVAVVANAATRVTSQVTTEVAHAGLELLKDDGLSFHLADLLRDNPLGHLLKNEETLLDDLDGLAMANNLLLFLDDNFAGGNIPREVVRAVEVVETGKGGDAHPVIEGNGGTGSQSPADLRHGRGRNTSNNSEDGDDLGKFGEHF